MSDESPKSCPKCGQRMSVGFSFDAVPGGGKPERWIEGKPQWSFWRGVKTYNKKQYEVATYRCIGCGFLESYADQEVP